MLHSWKWLYNFCCIFSCFTHAQEIFNPFIQERPDFNNHFVVVIPSYNNARWCERNLASIFAQDYPNYRIIYIDDASNDGTAQKVQKYVKEQNQEHRFTFIQNKERAGALSNRYKAIHSCANYEIIIMIDGDDWAAPRTDIFNILNTVYSNTFIWMTYGRYTRWCSHCTQLSECPFTQANSECEHLPGLGWCSELPPKELIDLNLWREYILYVMKEKDGWVFGALRTFYAGLFKAINKEDLFFQGRFFGRGSDLATTIPMAELAGHHIQFINEILYIYNREASMTENDSWEFDHLFTYAMIRQKRYQPLKLKNIL